MNAHEGPGAEPKPGFATSEFWSVVAAVATAFAACFSSGDRWVQIAALGALTVLGSVLGGLYVWSRTMVKTAARSYRSYT